jgi:hypothetical protein
VEGAEGHLLLMCIDAKSRGPGKSWQGKEIEASDTCLDDRQASTILSLQFTGICFRLRSFAAQ